ncbi:hypothetical protein [Streptomyces sp. NPDC087297]|uniref:hypothetical protein n=1 Tax=Streptomyces sp. NPDC087297 TaxID=3365778 RepID=UPI003801731B
MILVIVVAVLALLAGLAGLAANRFINVPSTAITEAERQATRDFLANHPAAELPCDANGNRRTI